MTNSNYPIDARDLSSRLNHLKHNNTEISSTHGSITMSPSGTRRFNRASSFDSLPRVRKSSTMSTTSSQSTRFSGLYGYPSSAVNRDGVEVSPGEFSMPRVPKRSRRGTDGSFKGTKTDGKKKNSFESYAYGRHSNQWLFNDFSITDAVKKGYGKMFGKDN